MAFKSTEITQEYIASLVERSRKAQRYFEANYKDQRSIDEVVHAIGVGVLDNAEELCAAAVSETGMGTIEGKKKKLIMVAGSHWKNCRGHQSVGYIDSPIEPGVRYMYKPLGVIGAVMPSTNPIATIIGNAMICFKSRNSIIVAPHPGSAKVSENTIEILRKALKKVGAPEDLLLGVSHEQSCIEATNELMRQCDVNIGTGGRGMVKAVYSSGRPGFGVGQGNCQELIDTDIEDARYYEIAAKTVANRSFDNGVPCTSDQTIYIPEDKEKLWVEACEKAGAYIMFDKAEIDALRELVFPNGGTTINREVVGRLPSQIGKMLGIEIPETAQAIVFKNQAWGDADVMCREILCPIMRYTTYQTFEEACEHAVETLYVEGAGHSASIWSYNQEHIDYFADLCPVGRLHVNQPTCGLGNGLWGTITIGCGSWGNNSISENLTWFHLCNKTKVSTVLPNLRPYDIIKEFDNYEPWKVTLDEN